MPDYLGVLVVPAVLAVAWVLGLCDCWGRRRRERWQRLEEKHPAFGTARRRPASESAVAREVWERGVLREAENVVYAANARLADLYLSPEEVASERLLEDVARAHSLFRP